jgi:deazaflavin-dependent oxidoreductase (nitroreductase family)
MTNTIRPAKSPMHTLAIVTRRLADPLAGSRWFPLWGVLRHVGRTSGRDYATPVVAIATDDGFLIPLPFGERTQWAKNLFAGRSGGMRHRGREHRVADPELVTRDSIEGRLPWFPRIGSRLLGLDQYVKVRRAD